MATVSCLWSSNGVIHVHQLASTYATGPNEFKSFQWSGGVQMLEYRIQV